MTETTKYDPQECERLIAEAREDDARLEAAPWTARRHGSMGHDDYVLTRSDGSYELLKEDEALALSRIRNNLRALADQLSTARLALDVAATIEAASQRTIESGNKAFTQLREAWWAERDKLREENRRLVAAHHAALTRGEE